MASRPMLRNKCKDLINQSTFEHNMIIIPESFLRIVPAIRTALIFLAKYLYNNYKKKYSKQCYVNVHQKGYLLLFEKPLKFF